MLLSSLYHNLQGRMLVSNNVTAPGKQAFRLETSNANDEEAPQATIMQIDAAGQSQMTQTR
jgi:hypothetical protein